MRTLVVVFGVVLAGCTGTVSGSCAATTGAQVIQALRKLPPLDADRYRTPERDPRRELRHAGRRAALGGAHSPAGAGGKDDAGRRAGARLRGGAARRIPEGSRS